MDFIFSHVCLPQSTLKSFLLCFKISLNIFTEPTNKGCLMQYEEWGEFLAKIRKNTRQI